MKDAAHDRAEARARDLWSRGSPSIHRRTEGVAALVIALASTACDRAGSRAGAPATAAAPPTVVVAAPVSREVVDAVEFIGRTDSLNAVDIRARVTGYLDRVGFVDGAPVRKNDVLFEIDPRPAQAQLDEANAKVALNIARLEQATADNARGKAIAAQNAGAISVQELERRQANQDEATAAVAAAKAEVESATLQLGFTKVYSPIDGRTSRAYVTAGNLVNQDTSLLTTVVAEDPMAAYFQVDEPTMLRVVRQVLESGIDPRRRGAIPVFMGLSDETGFPHEGSADFANNVVDASTGTILVRGIFANPASSNDVRLLRPGMFVRIRLPIGPPHEALLVSERALASDQGRPYVLVVNDAGVVERRSVELGAQQGDGLREVTSGVEKGDQVIVSGLQLVREGAKASVRKGSMMAASP
ncbi:MAG: efflux RND transporter periplasmic adaptor subunit [Phycisphaerales bacterium]